MKKLPKNIYHFSNKWPGPCVVIIGSLHGNEKVGKEVIDRLLIELPKHKIHGEIFLILGNPKAYSRNLRFVDCDLNRLFGLHFEDLKSKKHLNYEEKRALEIAPILEKANYLLDIHSTVKPSMPFVYIENTKSHRELAKIFKTKYVISPVKGFKPYTLSSSTDNFVDRNKGMGLTYESGWHEETLRTKEVLLKVRIFLKTIGSTFLHLKPTSATSKAKHLFIYKELKAKTEHFNFEKDFKNFDSVSSGEQIAQDKGVILADRNAFIVFPKKDIRRSQTALYLASEHITL
ncbi:MAG: succinylglutamate desuccinylase/aspartoacylase family protein [Candidatus Gracilibacteria bacterium]